MTSVFRIVTTPQTQGAPVGSGAFSHIRQLSNGWDTAPKAARTIVARG